MSELIRRTELNSGVVFEFFTRGNRYFGDFHRVDILAVVVVPFIRASLPENLREFAGPYHGVIHYEKSLQRMGVATSQVETVSQELIDNFLLSVRSYLEKPGFAEGLLHREMVKKAAQTSYY